MEKIHLLLLIFHISTPSHGANLRNELPIVRIFEIRPATSTKLEFGETEHALDKPPNSNIIIGEDFQPESKIVMECDARYPVQWVYNGDGTPEYSTNTTQTQNSGGITRPENVFSASLSLGFRRSISYHDTGKYTCRSLQNPELSVFYYLYAAAITNGNGKIFINPEGDTIYFKSTDNFVRIPCSVTNPRAVVSLQKSINGLVQCPLNESISFDSTIGFELKVSHFNNPAGTYVCTAGFNNTYQVVSYTLIRENNIEASSEKDSCTKNDECQSTLTCMQTRKGFKCASPCGSVCGRNTQCDVTQHVVRCQCLPGHEGDPYTACYSTSTPEPIQDPCIPNPCGLNTVCERHGTVSRCVCTPGTYGDPYVRCYPQQQARDPCHPNPCGPNSVCNHRNGFTSCTCRTGYYGQPPYCRAECEVNSHCPSDRACYFGRCRNPCEGACLNFHRTECRVINRQPVCATVSCRPGYYGRDCLSLYVKEDGQITTKYLPSRVGEAAVAAPESKPEGPCSPSPCGVRAECTVKKMTNNVLNLTNDVAFCQCPGNSTGNADVECYPVEEHVLENTEAHPSTTSSHNKCTPECGINANCTDKNSCTCPKRTQGNPLIKCYPIFCNQLSDCDNINAACVSGRCVEQGSAVLEVPGESVNKPCGINAIAVKNTNTCICPSNYSGNPESACHLITSSNANQTTDHATGVEEDWTTNRHKQNTTCQDGTRLKCGVNAVCKRFHDEERCVCDTEYFGDPTSPGGCRKREQCRRNAQCNTEEECVEGKCLNVCRHRDICGSMAGCTGENHKHNCICHIGTILNQNNGECEPMKGALAERLLVFRNFEDI